MVIIGESNLQLFFLAPLHPNHLFFKPESTDLNQSPANNLQLLHLQGLTVQVTCEVHNHNVTIFTVPFHCFQGGMLSCSCCSLFSRSVSVISRSCFVTAMPRYFPRHLRCYLHGSFNISVLPFSNCTRSISGLSRVVMPVSLTALSYASGTKYSSASS